MKIVKHSSAALAALAVSAVCGSTLANDPQIKVARPLPLMQSTKAPAPAEESGVRANLPQATTPPFGGPAPTSRRAMPAKGLPANAPSLGHDRFDRDRVFIAEAGDVVWAHGKDWKASFDGSRATFIPFLGSDAPHNFPVVMRIDGLRAGNSNLPFTEQGSVAHTNDRVTIDHGGFVEIYDLSPGSIEQTFEIGTRPASGDLAVRLSLDSELVARDTVDGIVLENERGGVRYGRARAIDANGATLTSRTQLVDGHVEIVIANEALERATLPVRIDPVVSTFAIDNSTFDDFLPDIAYDGPLPRYCVVYEEVYSAADHDVISTVRDTSGNSLNIDAYIDFTSDSWTEPKVACNAEYNNFMAVATVHPLAGGNSYIGGCVRSSTIVYVSPQMMINGPESGPKLHPDIGGDPSAAPPTYYCVVWERDYQPGDTDIHARLVTPNGTLYGPGTILLEDSSGTADWFPRISKSDGALPFATQEWNIVWMRYVTIPITQNEAMGAQIHWDGGITTPTTGLSASFSDQRNVVVSSPMDDPSGAPRPYMAVWEVPTAQGTHQLIGVVAISGVQTGSDQNLSVGDGVNVNEDHILPSVDCDGDMFAVGFSESYAGSTYDYDAYVSSYFHVRLGGVGYIIPAESHALLDYSVQPSYGVKMGSQHSGGAPTLGNRYGVVWENDASATNIDVYAGFYEGPAGEPPINFCSSNGQWATCPCGNQGSPANGCANSVNPNGARLDATGQSLTQSDTLVLTGSGMPSNAPCLFFQGTNYNGGAAFGDGVRCISGTVIRLGTKTCVGGVASYPELGDATVSLKGLVPAIGGARFYQTWYRNSDPTFCTAATFNLSSGCLITWLP